MAVSFGCKCEERNKPIKERRWVVTQRNENRSAFNGYRRQWSAYSTVYCRRCMAVGRTKARYVHSLPDGKYN